VRLTHAGKIAGRAVQQQCWHAQARGELDERAERARETVGQRLGPQDRIGTLGILCAIEQAERGVPVEIVIARADDAVRRAQPGGGKKLLDKPLCEFGVAPRSSLPCQIAR
jgi:hypothetical protein